MNKVLKKICVLVLAVSTVLAMSTTAFASPTVNNQGEQGAFTTPDTPATQGKVLQLSKELTAYSPAGAGDIYAPDISYTYTIAPATVPANATVTDNANKHTSNTAVTVPVKAGVGTPVIANSGVVAWTNTDMLVANVHGDPNKKDIAIDFSSVVFTGAGVYRYEITEALTSGYTYASSGVTETTDATNGHTRFVDVYVRPATTGYTDGSTAAQWDIYGFTCFYNNVAEITDANKTTSPVKTTGFVAGTTNGTDEVKADSYYTFSVMVSKNVVNDGYGAATVAFPFTIIFTNDVITRTVDIQGYEKSATATGYLNPPAGVINDTKGILYLKSGGMVRIYGIPCGTSVEIYETNVATGVTYKVDTTVNHETPTTDNAVSWGTAPSSAVAQAATKEAYQSTKATITTTAGAEGIENDVEITNTLLTISPTGVVLRIAPYALILAAGIILFFVARRRKEDKEELANA